MGGRDGGREEGRERQISQQGFNHETEGNPEARLLTPPLSFPLPLSPFIPPQSSFPFLVYHFLISFSSCSSSYSISSHLFPYFLSSFPITPLFLLILSHLFSPSPLFLTLYLSLIFLPPSLSSYKQKHSRKR